MIPLIDLTLPKTLNNQIKKEVAKVIDSKNFILGPQVESFEKKFAEYIGTRYAIGVGSGTDALRLALRALGIGRGDKVLTVSLTSPFTAIAIVEEGAIPVFCDVDEDTFTIDINDAEKKMDSKTKAIIPVHIFGNPSNLDLIVNFASKYKLKIIEDSCQAHGAKFNNKRVGSFGDANAFSFYPTKNLGALGDAGIINTNIKKLANFIKVLRHGGQSKRFWHGFQGVNSRLDEIQAAVLRVKLKYLDDDNQRRITLATRYRDKLNNLPLKFQETFPGVLHVYHLFVIKTINRDKLQKYLLKRGIVTDVYYPYPAHLQPVFKNYSTGNLKNTEKLAKELLALPLYPQLKFEDQDIVIGAIKEFFKKN